MRPNSPAFMAIVGQFARPSLARLRHAAVLDYVSLWGRPEVARMPQSRPEDKSAASSRIGERPWVNPCGYAAGGPNHVARYHPVRHTDKTSHGPSPLAASCISGQAGNVPFW